MEVFQREYPELPMMLYADHMNAPYGGKSGNDIRMLTRKGVETLFAQ